MPVLVVASTQTAALWKMRHSLPAKLETAVLLLGIVALPLVTVYCTQRVDLAAMPRTVAQGAFVGYPGAPNSSHVA